MFTFPLGARRLRIGSPRWIARRQRLTVAIGTRASLENSRWERRDRPEQVSGGPDTGRSETSGCRARAGIDAAMSVQHRRADLIGWCGLGPLGAKARRSAQS